MGFCENRPPAFRELIQRRHRKLLSLQDAEIGVFDEASKQLEASGTFKSLLFYFIHGECPL